MNAWLVAAFIGLYPGLGATAAAQTVAAAAIQPLALQSITFVSGSGKPVLIITPDGKFVLGPGAAVDSAAIAIIKLANERRLNSCSGYWHVTRNGTAYYEVTCPDKVVAPFAVLNPQHPITYIKPPES